MSMEDAAARRSRSRSLSCSSSSDLSRMHSVDGCESFVRGAVHSAAAHPPLASSGAYARLPSCTGIHDGTRSSGMPRSFATVGVSQEDTKLGYCAFSAVVDGCRLLVSILKSIAALRLLTIHPVPAIKYSNMVFLIRRLDSSALYAQARLLDAARALFADNHKEHPTVNQMVAHFYVHAPRPAVAFDTPNSFVYCKARALPDENLFLFHPSEGSARIFCMGWRTY